MGPDTDVTRLLQAAEVESLQRNKKRDEGNRYIDEARTLLEKRILLARSKCWIAPWPRECCNRRMRKRENCLLK